MAAPLARRDILSGLAADLHCRRLGRGEPRQEEVRAWTEHILRRCAEVGMVVIEEVAEAFFTSEEYLRVPKSHRKYVTILYRVFLARNPEPAGLEQWVNYLVRQLAAIEDELIDSAAFQGRLPQLFLRPQQLCSQS